MVGSTESGPGACSVYDVPELHPETVHIWTLNLPHLAPLLPRLARPLSDTERRRAQRFVHGPSRVEFTLVRGALRCILAAYCNAAPESLVIAPDELGKPALTPPSGGLQFNVSHSGDVALIAVGATSSLGVDVERVKASRDLKKLAARFFSPSECAALSALPAGDFVAGFYRCWTSKEAYVKGLGQGLHYNLSKFAVGVSPGEAELCRDSCTPENAGLWRLVALEVPAGYVATLACPTSCVGAPRYCTFAPR